MKRERGSRVDASIDFDRDVLGVHFAPGVRVAAGPSSGLTIRREEVAPIEISIPSLPEHLIVVALQDGILREWALPDGRLHRRWSILGSLTVAPAHSEYRCKILTRSQVLIVNVSTEALNDAAKEAFGAAEGSVTLMHRFSINDVHLCRLLLSLMQEMSTGDDASTVAVRLLSRSFVISLIRDHSTISSRGPKVDSTIPSGRLDRIVNFMENNVDRNLSVAELAAEIGLSKSYFTSMFRRAKGQSPYRYLVSLRIEKSRQLLQHSDLSIIEVGLACGFERPAHFASTFHRIVGMSPRAWRAARQ